MSRFGGIVGALVGLGIPEYEAKRIVGQVQVGGILLSVHCDSPAEITAATDALEATGGRDISSAREVALPDIIPASPEDRPASL